MQLNEPVERPSGGYPWLFYIKFCIYCFFLWCKFFVHYALRVERKLSTCLEFQFLRRRGCLTNPFRTLPFCFGLIGKTPGFISHYNFVKKNYLHRPSRCLGKMWLDLSSAQVSRSVEQNVHTSFSFDIYMSKAGVYSCNLVNRTVPWRHAGDIDRYWYEYRVSRDAFRYP
jgi:hypothetical protein